MHLIAEWRREKKELVNLKIDQKNIESNYRKERVWRKKNDRVTGTCGTIWNGLTFMSLESYRMIKNVVQKNKNKIFS